MHIIIDFDSISISEFMAIREQLIVTSDTWNKSTKLGVVSDKEKDAEFNSIITGHDNIFINREPNDVAVSCKIAEICTDTMDDHILIVTNNEEILMTAYSVTDDSVTIVCCINNIAGYEFVKYDPSTYSHLVNGHDYIPDQL